MSVLYYKSRWFGIESSKSGFWGTVGLFLVAHRQIKVQKINKIQRNTNLKLKIYTQNFHEIIAHERKVLYVWYRTSPKVAIFKI